MQCLLTENRRSWRGEDEIAAMEINVGGEEAESRWKCS